VEGLKIKLVIGRDFNTIKELEPSLNDISFTQSFSSHHAVTVVLLHHHYDETRSIVSRKMLAQ
jgi:hypothetical protein